MKFHRYIVLIIAAGLSLLPSLLTLINSLPFEDWNIDCINDWCNVIAGMLFIYMLICSAIRSNSKKPYIKENGISEWILTNVVCVICIVIKILAYGNQNSSDLIYGILGGMVSSFIVIFVQKRYRELFSSSIDNNSNKIAREINDQENMETQDTARTQPSSAIISSSHAETNITILLPSGIKVIIK
ncbi:MAG: hypothetical protein IJQ35_00415 [Bacteroidales bacterium]|nr:hypothetical protein [Bacteroidales bacterium]